MLKTLVKASDDSKQRIKIVNFDPKKALQSPGEGSSRLKNTPLRGYHPNRNRVGYEQRNSFFINTPTLTSSAINGSFEKSSKNYLSTSIAETQQVSQNGEIIVKSRTKLNVESSVIDEIEQKKPVALNDELKKDTIIVTEPMPSLQQIKYKSNQTPIRELGGSQRLQRRSQSTLKLRDFYLLRESPSKHGLSQQFIKGPACKESSDSANTRKSIKFIETPKEIETIAARAMRHVKSISGHYIQIKGPVNMETEMYHIPISRFNQAITGKEAKSLLKSISYANSRKQSESRDSSYKDIEYRSGVDRSFKGNTKETTIMMDIRENSNEISRIRTREDQDGKLIRAWRVSTSILNREKKRDSHYISSAGKIEEKYEKDETESKRDYRLQTDEEIVDTARPKRKEDIDLKNIQPGEQEEEGKASEFGSVNRRSSREVLLSYKSKKSGLFINHQKVPISSYVNAMDPAKQKDDTRTREDISLESSLIKPLEKVSPTNL